MKDYYKLLEISENASPEVIQAAYKTLAKKNHPDLYKDAEKPMKEKIMKDLNIAKDILLDSKKREIYNIELKAEKEKYNYKPNSKNTCKKRVLDEEKNINDKTSKISRFTSSIFDEYELMTISLKIILVILMFFCSYFIIFSTQSFFKILKETNTTIKLSMTSEQVTNILGPPDNTTPKFLKYKTAKILIDENGKTIGWIDTYKVLPIKRYSVIPNVKNISIGMKKSDIISKWGMPDTYSKEILVYDNIIIKFNDDLVIEINNNELSL